MKTTGTTALMLALHARVEELEAMLDSVGAGGVAAPAELNLDDYYCKGCGRIGEIEELNAQDKEKLRKIEGKPKTVAAPVVLPEPVAAQIRHIKEERWRTIVLDLYDLFAGDEYERRYIYTEQQVRDLLAKATCTKSQTGAQEPFGYFKAEPFGWVDCAETDEGSIALYEAPQPQAAELDAQRYRWLRAQPLESDMFCTTIWRKGSDGFGDDLRLEELDAAIDAAMAASKENN